MPAGHCSYSANSGACSERTDGTARQAGAALDAIDGIASNYVPKSWSMNACRAAASSRPWIWRTTLPSEPIR